MTQDKARKTAARQRMAGTGEPYSVARRAVAAGPPDAPAGDRADIGANPPAPGPRPVRARGGQIVVRYRLDQTFELEVDEEAWAEADDDERAQLIAETAGGPDGPHATLAELIAQDLRDHGARGYAMTVAGAAARDWEEDADAPDWQEQYYADGAASEGITVAEFKARQTRGPARQRAVQPEPDTERAQEQAHRAQGRADRAQGRAEEAQRRAEEAQRRADAARDRADEMRELADDAREDVAVAADEEDPEERARAERTMIRAIREVELADREADRAQELADRARELADQEQEQADREQERAEREQERAERGQERADDLDDHPHHTRSVTFRAPPPPGVRLPRAPRLPRPPRLPRLPRLPG